VLIHGWPLSGGVVERQVAALLARVIASSRTTQRLRQVQQTHCCYNYDTFAARSHALAGHAGSHGLFSSASLWVRAKSPGISGKYGTKRVRKAVLIGTLVRI